MVYDFFEELKDIIKEKIKELYIKFKYFLLVLVFILLVLCIFLCVKEEPITIETQQLKLFEITLENWAQWITIITIPYTAGWAIYQFRKSSIAKKQEKAVQIAREFSGDLINKCGIINQVYKSSSLNPILKFDEKNYDDFKFFNTDELRRIYNDDDFPTKYQDLREKVANELDTIYHYILLRRVSPFDAKIVLERQMEDEGQEEQEEQKEQKEETPKKEKKDKKKITPFMQQNVNFPYHFMDLESDVLNQLEYICMDVSSKATDSKFIYQSLHQMFLRTVRTLAVEISVDNLNYSDKFYTNIIHVYNDWTIRYKKDLKVEKRKKEKIDKILNPKIKTV